MKSWHIHVLNFVLFTLLVGIYFYPLFFPTLNLIVTPDFGRSDAWHFSMATKYFFSETIERGQIPIWSSVMGGGFPLLGEGQVGAFFLPNLFLYSLLSFPIAYNLSLVFIFLLFGWGVYALLIHFKISSAIALFGTVSLTFSGIIIPQLPHVTLLQALSLFPIMLLLGFRFIEHPSLRKGILLAVVGSQQFFAGFPQATVLTWGLIGLYLFFWNGYSIKILKSLLLLFTVVIGMVCLSAIQLLPSQEFLRYTNISSGFDLETATAFSFPPKHLGTLIDPYIYGSPKDGSFPPFFQIGGTIFWETSAYVGIIPLIGVLVYMIQKAKTSGARKLKISLILVLVLSFLLMLGKFSPLYFVFSYWPLNLFRVPARFLWYFCLVLVLMGTLGLESIISVKFKRTYIILCSTLIVIQFIQAYNYWKSYHLVEPYNTWISRPESTKYISSNSTVYPFGDYALHNEYFISNGWATNPEIFVFSNNTIAPNSNIYWDVKSMKSYSGRNLARMDIVESLLEENFSIENKIATVSSSGKKLLRLYGVTEVITPFSITNLTPIATVSGATDITIYDVPEPLPRMYTAKTLRVSETVQGSSILLTDNVYDPKELTLVEEPFDLQFPEHEAVVHITESTDSKVLFSVQNPNPHDILLIIQDTYYSGWKATVNGEEKKIYPVNIRNRGILVPSGESNISMYYQPNSLKRGSQISIFSHFIAIVLMIFPFRVLTRRIS